MNETPPQAPEQKDNTKKRNISLILSWMFGSIFLLAGIGSLASHDFLQAIITLILSGILLPPLCNFIEKKSKLRLSRGVKAIILIIGLGIVAVTVNTEEGKEKAKQKEQIVTKETIDKSPINEASQPPSEGQVIVEFNKDTGESKVVAKAPVESKELQKLSFSRSQIVNKMSAAEKELDNPPLPKGKEYASQDGTKNFQIVYPDDLTILEIAGNPDNVESVSFSVGIPADNPVQAVTQVGRTMVLLQLITPSLGKSADWLQSRIDMLNEGKKKIEETHDNIRVRISDYRATIGFIIFSFEVAK